MENLRTGDNKTCNITNDNVAVKLTQKKTVTNGRTLDRSHGTKA